MREDEFKHKISEAIEAQLDSVIGVNDFDFGQIEAQLVNILNEIKAKWENKKKDEAISNKFKSNMAVAIYGEFHAGFDVDEYGHIEKRLVENLHNIAMEWLMEKVKL